MKPIPHFELTIWILALLILVFLQPEENHFSLCPLASMGFDWCPGCGLGRSIACVFQGDIVQSLRYHWFGMPALLILFHRIFVLGKNVSYLSKKH